MPIYSRYNELVQNYFNVGLIAIGLQKYFYLETDMIRLVQSNMGLCSYAVFSCLWQYLFFSDKAVSVVVGVVVVVVVGGVNLFGFSTFSLEPLHGFASNFVWMFLGGHLLSLLKSWCYPYFSWNYG